ncbi:MAG: histidine phosphatase family protein [Syntrophomonadaceae bacterium]|jgi:broad specificity phosphatase PhoE|nr:histidine phosphatase family protein [Bacillota bacterium]HOQ10427.1 histidine phosphatase family protein [Syntrophomonadaceae bacterium]HPU49548.1 histidine phosphatase family protein [Syntrophomonadaceae bacterium]HQA08051.1 histidine phosphatase family protein [Syntrophomonadaceae bacterium]
MSELIFIRHGQASFGRGDYDALSDRGKEQALLVAQYLLNTGVSFDKAYSGTLKRQVDTAEIILDYLCAHTSGIPELRKLEGLNEYQFEGVIQHYLPIVAGEDDSIHPLIEQFYTDNKSFQLVFDRITTKWLADDTDPDGVEGWSRFKARVEQALRLITAEIDKNSRVIIFSSGGVISTALHLATGMSPYNAIRTGWRLVNTSITKFGYGRSGLVLHTFNSYPHLEYCQSGELITYR